MRKIILLIAMMAFSVAAYAQQNITSQNLPEFYTVEFQGRLQVELQQSDTARMDITLRNIDADRLEWSVENGTLFIRLKPGRLSDASADVNVYYNKINNIKISGSNVASTSVITVPMLDVELSSGATFKSEVDVKDLKLHAGGNSVADITGSAKYYLISSGMRSAVNARYINAVDARIEASGSSEVFATSSERMVIIADTGASVYYRGEPELLRTTARTMATINTIGK